MTPLSDSALQNAPRFFGRRIFLRLTTGFCLLFALVVFTLWKKHAAGVAAVERAVPVVQLDAAPLPGETESLTPP